MNDEELNEILRRLDELEHRVENIDNDLDSVKDDLDTLSDDDIVSKLNELWEHKKEVDNGWII